MLDEFVVYSTPKAAGFLAHHCYNSSLLNLQYNHFLGKESAA